MRGIELLEKFNLVDEKWVTDAERTCKKPRALIWMCRIAAVAAAVCIAMGIFVRTDAYLFSDVLESIYGPTTQALHYKECIVEQHLAAYRLISHSEHQQEMLAHKKGEYYAQTKDTTIYRYAGRDDLVYLIFEHNGDGTLQLGEFMHFYALDSGPDLIESQWYKLFGAEHFTAEQIQAVVPVTFSEMLRVIYGIRDAEDIRSLTFTWNYPTSQKQKYERFVIHDRETVSEFYGMISSLEYQQNISEIPLSEKQAERQKLAKEWSKRGAVLSHLSRTIKVRLKNGYTIEMRYSGYRGELRILYGAEFRLSDEYNDWFIKHGEVDFNYQPYVPEFGGSWAETTVLPTTTYATTTPKVEIDPTPSP